jgi:glutathione S-transferase
MQIYFSPTSPYVRKCLVVAHELGLSSKIELLPSHAHPVQRDAQIIRSNPLGKVPTLLCDDGSVLYDSRVICEYFDDLQGGGLFPKSGPERWQALTLQALADGMLDAALLARYEQAARPELLRWNDWLAGQIDKLSTSLAALEKDSHTLAGHVDIGTLSVACALWYVDLRFADLNWRPRHPGVAAWAADIGLRPSLQASWSL